MKEIEPKLCRKPCFGRYHLWPPQQNLWADSGSSRFSGVIIAVGKVLSNPPRLDPYGPNAGIRHCGGIALC